MPTPTLDLEDVIEQREESMNPKAHTFIPGDGDMDEKEEEVSIK
jgi:hypothetical protein